VRLSRRASLGSLAAAVAAPLTAALLGRDTSEAVVLALLAVLVVFRHAPNIGRLARGREGPLGPAGGGGPGLR